MAAAIACKDATGRGFRSSLDATAAAGVLPLGSHRGILSLRVGLMIHLDVILNH